MAERVKINIALQGGGTHGAFTWGVLDRLLEEEDRLVIEGISGTSAGAINGAVLIDGYMKDGYDGAKSALEKFWTNVAHYNAFNPMRRTVAEQLSGDWNLNRSLGYKLTEFFLSVASPYSFNPLNYNPLRDVLAESLSFENLQSCSMIKFFVTATRVYSGRPRVFRCEEITLDVLLATSCIPQIFQAVEIEGEPYWDGGYMGNPSLWPFIDECTSSDILLVQINPLVRKEIPKTPMEITNRLNEISFNSSLVAEVRAMAFVSKLLHAGRLDPKRYREILFHIIEKPEEMMRMNASSKFNCEWKFLTHLRDIGRRAANDWLEKNFNKIGVESSAPIHEIFLQNE